MKTLKNTLIDIWHEFAIPLVCLVLWITGVFKEMNKPLDH